MIYFGSRIKNATSSWDKIFDLLTSSSNNFTNLPLFYLSSCSFSFSSLLFYFCVLFFFFFFLVFFFVCIFYSYISYLFYLQLLLYFVFCSSTSKLNYAQTRQCCRTRWDSEREESETMRKWRVKQPDNKRNNETKESDIYERKKVSEREISHFPALWRFWRRKEDKSIISRMHNVSIRSIRNGF